MVTVVCFDHDSLMWAGINGASSSLLPVASAGDYLGLEDPLLRQLSHLTGQVVLTVSWEFSRGCWLCSTCACLSAERLGLSHSMATGFQGQEFQTGCRNCQRLMTDTTSLLSSSIGQAQSMLRFEARRPRPQLSVGSGKKRAATFILHEPRKVKCLVLDHTASTLTGPLCSASSRSCDTPRGAQST